MRTATTLALVLTLVVIILGAYTRLKDAGLGCPDWPGCYGTLTVPSSPEELQRAQTQFPDAPVDRTKAWIEVIHRMFAGSLGLLIFGLTLANIIKSRRAKKPAAAILIAASILVFFQSILGMLTVTLQLLPQVVTAHLFGGFATLALVFIYLIQLNSPATAAVKLKPAETKAARQLLRLSYLGVVLIIIQIFFGGWVSTNYAALACGDFPSCNGALVPPSLSLTNLIAGFDLFQPVGSNYEGGLLSNEARVAIHWMHRLGALVLVIFWLSFYGFARWRQLPGQTAISLVLAVLFLQVLLGITNILGELPLLVATAHNAVAALLLLSGIYLIIRARNLATRAA